MKVLRGGRGLADLDVVTRRELQVALDARAGVFGALSFVPVREQQDQAAEQSPLILPCRHELVDDDLRAVSKVAKLRLPQRERLGKIAAVAVLETHHPRFGQ